MSFWSELPLLRTLPERDRRAVLLGAAVLLPAVLWIAAVRPYRNAVNELHEQVAAERALLEREQQLLSRAASLPDALMAAEQDAHRAELRLVRAPNTPLAEAELSSYLESVAALSRVLLQDMRGIEPQRNESFPGTVRPIRLAVSGESDMIGVIHFLNSLEGSPLLIRIRELTIEPVYESGGSGRNGGTLTNVMQFALTIEAFAPAESTVVESPMPRPTRPDTEVAP